MGFLSYGNTISDGTGRPFQVTIIPLAYISKRHTLNQQSQIQLKGAKNINVQGHL